MSFDISIYEKEAYKFPHCKCSACISLKRKNETDESPAVAKNIKLQTTVKELKQEKIKIRQTW